MDSVERELISLHNLIEAIFFNTLMIFLNVYLVAIFTLKIKNYFLNIGNPIFLV